MRLKEIKFKNFRRFPNLTISGLSEHHRLILLIGPNGCGKSSVFDGFRFWQTYKGHFSHSLSDETYYFRDSIDHKDAVNIQFFDKIDPSPISFYIRSAYRNTPEFNVGNIGNLAEMERSPRLVCRSIDNDSSIEENYNRLLSYLLRDIFNKQNDELTGKTIRERIISILNDSLEKIGLEMRIASLGEPDPLSKGNFYYIKGEGPKYNFKNLSGGEKAAFDLILDVVIKREVFNDSIYCIDEPELHLHTKLQGSLLKTLYNLLPYENQLFISTHSLGMIQAARELHNENPEAVAFIYFGDRDFNLPQNLSPNLISREFWKKYLSITLHDLANLIAPKTVVLCEGDSSGRSRQSFDANCLRRIFSISKPDTDFVAVGNSSDVKVDRHKIGESISGLIEGTIIIRLIDRDDMNEVEITKLRSKNIKVLSKRHIESYLWDDEVLTKLCEVENKQEMTKLLLDAKAKALAESTARNHSCDDMKSAAGTLYNEIKRLLSLTQRGSTSDAFAENVLAPLITPDLDIYKQLESDIFS
jgi:predicted ATPase